MAGVPAPVMPPGYGVGSNILSLTGATAAVRFVGGTTSGAPSTGTFAVGDIVIDQTGFIWACTAAGSPGTWVCISSGREVAYTQNVATNETTTSTTAEDFANAVSVALPLLPVPVMLHAHSRASNGTTDKGSALYITRVGDGAQEFSSGVSSVGGAVGTTMIDVWWRIPANTAADTYKLQKSVTGAAGTATLYSTSISRQFLRAVTV